MGVLPPTKLGRIQFCEQHDAPFSANAVAIGTTAAAVTDLQTKTLAARNAFNAQQEAQNAAKAATNTYDLAVKAMTSAVADILKQVKTKAALAGDGVYSLAEIPVPAQPSPRPAPGKPADFTAILEENGAVTITWKCPNPAGTSGTIYQIWRRIGPEGEFTYLAGTGARRFTDETIPAGSTGVTYQIQAVRSTAVGPWAQFNVNFGVSSGGTITASVVETQPAPPAKIAA